MSTLELNTLLRAAIPVFALVSTALGTVVYLTWAGPNGVIDQPGPRSSHQRETITGGGVALVVGVASALPLFYALNVLSQLLLTTLGIGVLFAALGVADDRASLAVRPRLLIQAGLCVLYLVLIVKDVPPAVFVWCLALGSFSLIWMVNLFNFMDGIDGIAASQALFVAIAAQFFLPQQSDLALLLLAIAGASAAFVYFNWAPARLFMGDTGSLFLGFLAAAIAISDSLENPARGAIWAILWAIFIADASLTLLLRVLRRKPLHQAHRDHAYQRLAKRYGEHRAVTWRVMVVNVVWLFPLAVLANRFPERAWVFCGVAYAPLLTLVLAIDRSEKNSRPNCPNRGNTGGELTGRSG